MYEIKVRVVWCVWVGAGCIVIHGKWGGEKRLGNGWTCSSQKKLCKRMQQYDWRGKPMDAEMVCKYGENDFYRESIKEDMCQ